MGEDASAVMRRAALLLLLLVLPGLLLPAGARWHVCGCAAPMSAQPAACCAPSSPPSDAAPALPPQLRLAIAPWTVVAPPALRAWSARQQRPPPHPFAARNLPLRI